MPINYYASNLKPVEVLTPILYSRTGVYSVLHYTSLGCAVVQW